MIKILSVILYRCVGLCFSCFRLLHNGRKTAFGPKLSSTGLSGSERDDNVSNLLDTSRKAVISNKDVEKFGIPHRMHSHAILLLKDLLFTPYISKTPKFFRTSLMLSGKTV